MIDKRGLMRARPMLICIFTVGRACMANASAAEQDDNCKTAEAAFKNIKVLKGINASELIPTMVFIRSSLCVECNFCHVSRPKWSPELDQKEEKKTARRMILMMRQINQQNFNGETRVTCATCHQGHSPAKTPPLMETSRAGKQKPKR